MSLSVVQSVFVFLSELMLAESLQLTVTTEDTPRKDCHTADLVSDKDFIFILFVCIYFLHISVQITPFFKETVLHVYVCFIYLIGCVVALLI